MKEREPRGLALVTLLGALVACASEPATERAPQARDLDQSDVARVASERIDGASVQAIARAQRTSLVVARDRAIRDALFALEARARGRTAHAAEASLLARKLLEERRRELDGPVTDEELAAATLLHWLELDRPEGYRTVHALAVVGSRDKKKPVTDATWETADAVGKRIAEAAIGAVDKARAVPDDDAAVLAELRRALATVESSGLETKAEDLPAVAKDGRVLFRGGGNFAPDFAAAVAKLRERGDVTPPFRSPFGVHVAILLARVPPATVPTEERRAMVRDEVLGNRVAQARLDLVAARAPTVEVAANVAALLDLVRIGEAPPAGSAAVNPAENGR